MGSDWQSRLRDSPTRRCLHLQLRSELTNERKNRRKAKDLRKSATLVPHGTNGGAVRDDAVDPEVTDGIEDEVVSPEGIEPSTNRLRVCCSAS